VQPSLAQQTTSNALNPIRMTADDTQITKDPPKPDATASSDDVQQIAVVSETSEKAATLARVAQLPPVLIQYALIGTGVLTGDPDGQIGPRTHNAIVAYQHSERVAETGTLTPEETISFVRAAAERGQPESQNTLGIMLANGIGLPKDEAAATKWFIKAADKSAQGKFNLALMLRDGRGVAADPAKATSLLKEARAAGYLPAAGELARSGGGKL
jgi:hypothetical protein